MATELDQLLEQLKELIGGFKNIGQYTKDLTSALQGASRPMQQMSDLTKAIKSQSEEAAKYFGEISKNMADIPNKIGEMNKELKEAVGLEDDYGKRVKAANADKAEANATAAQERAKNAAFEAERAEYYYKRELQGKEENDRLKTTLGLWERIGAAMGQAQQEFVHGKKEWNPNTRQMEQVSAAHPWVGGGLTRSTELLTGSSNMGDVAKNVISGPKGLMSVVSTMGPVGGLLGAMIYGKVKEEDYRVVGESAAQMFDVFGKHLDGFAGKLSKRFRSLIVAEMISKEDIKGVTGAFAELGFGEETTKALSGFSSIGGDDAIAYALSMEKALELANGAGTRLFGTFSRDLNLSLEEGKDLMTKLGGAAIASGANIAVFMQQTLETASAFRFLNANIEAVYSSTSLMSKEMQDKGFTAQFSNQYAAAGMSNLAQSIPNMNVGISSVIGQRLGFGGGLDAYYKMMTPQPGEQGKLDTNKIFLEMQRMLPKNKPESEQWYFAQKVFGLDAQGANALLKYKTGGSTQKENEEYEKLIKGGIGGEAGKVNQILNAVERIRDHIAQVMTGLLTLVVTGIKLLYNGIMMLVDMWQIKFGGGDNPEKDLKIRKENQARLLGITETTSKNIVKHVLDAAKIIPELADSTFGINADHIGGYVPNTAAERAERRERKKKEEAEAQRRLDEATKRAGKRPFIGSLNQNVTNRTSSSFSVEIREINDGKDFNSGNGQVA